MTGLRERGVSPHHRRTFQRIRGILEGDQLSFELGGGLVDEPAAEEDETGVQAEVSDT